ncbi:hypothetical protein H072_8725 [Dactylellina haptotyla CBS 200.50]|uniref:Uncharacterized protein n=1 Tax=Dactylellina haptotyla (strain CBS 200.50) TaxID=1284197 RepID=S8A474_DACHA|nr:hypothetical protein H072_8725 [Dactylellina haptotyla CBS 200.50]
MGLLGCSPTKPLGSDTRRPLVFVRSQATGQSAVASDLAIQVELADNPFAGAAISHAYIKDCPTTWEDVPHISGTTYSCPPPTRATLTSAENSLYDSGYGTASLPPSIHSPLTGSSAPKLELNGTNNVAIVDTPSIEGVKFLSEAEFFGEDTNGNELSFPKARKPAIVQSNLPYQIEESRSVGYTCSERSLPTSILPGLTTRRVCSKPSAYLLKHELSDNGVLLGEDGQIQSLFHAQKESYFRPLPYPPPISYHEHHHDSHLGIHQPTSAVRTTSFSQPLVDHGEHPPINPIQWIQQTMPQLKEDIIPTFDMGYYPDILCLPPRPSDVVVYFNSLCGAVAIPTDRQALIEDSIFIAAKLFDELDDCIFQMCDALNSKRLKSPNGDVVYKFVMERHNGKEVPNSGCTLDWSIGIKTCRKHLRQLQGLGYMHVMNKSKVEVVWKAITQYRNEWANCIFSGCMVEGWEASEEDMEVMKNYHSFNRELHRLIKSIEDDLTAISILENMANSFAAAIVKAEDKLRRIRHKFGIMGGDW